MSSVDYACGSIALEHLYVQAERDSSGAPINSPLVDVTRFVPSTETCLTTRHANQRIMHLLQRAIQGIHRYPKHSSSRLGKGMTVYKLLASILVRSSGF